MKLKTLTIIAAICLGIGTVHAQITKQIAYQGVLKDGTGNVTGTVDVTVNIYTGGASIEELDDLLLLRHRPTPLAGMVTFPM